MTRQGSYPKGVAKREEIIEKALEVVARVGYSGATVRHLADAVGLTQNGLLYYFGSKENLFVEILRHRDRLDEVTYGSGDSNVDMGGSVARLIRHSSDVPGLVQLYAGLVAEATSPEHPAHSYLQERHDAFRARVADAVRTLQDAGNMPRHVEPESLAVVMLAVMDGLQTQWLYDPSIDMAAQFLRFWNQVSSLPAPADRNQ
ncbi:TetR/AcrR family transcriptional regulator [Pseudarthrobacter sp. NS4]|uniref:TetR/AcrR family transcriptional regulator n=1 Tax=Pseudarthrobacter sp. NS4 TaxID=2973976 RepID=UPI002161B8BC|nr:TetR/AcrR family transcriptional regulator [Pseudarthrobacter sp. NS4]